uniref:PDZ domain-containing protein n=1 Tax=Macrostomum lignano TaxID=282301 RepID=A0A1I8FH86_9PLAT
PSESTLAECTTPGIITTITNATSLAAPNRQPTSRPSSMLSSDLDTTSFFRQRRRRREQPVQQRHQHHLLHGRRPHGRLSLQNRKRQNRRRRGPPISRQHHRVSLSLNVQTVELDMDAVQFLGISISTAAQEASTSVQSCAAALWEREGSIQPGDMLLESVNGVTFENLENDEAVRILREQVQKPGKITLVLCRASGVSGGGSSQVTPAASCMGGENLCDSRLTVTAASVSTSSCSLPESERYTAEELMPPLTTRTDLITIVKLWHLPDSGLEAFIGSDLVDWLYSRVEGFSERKEARKMALEMLKRVSFSEQCYYVFETAPGTSLICTRCWDSAQAPLPTMGMSKLNLMDSGADLACRSPSLLSSILLGLMSSQQQQQQQQHNSSIKLHHQIPLPPPQGTWWRSAASYPNSSSASSRSRSSIPMTIPPTSQSSVGVHPLSQQPQQSQMSHSFVSSASAWRHVSTANRGLETPGPSLAIKN